MGKYVIPYFEGEDEALGELAGNAAAARRARNVTTDHGQLASAAGLSPYIEEPVPGEAVNLYVFCETDEEGVSAEYVVVGTKTGVYVRREENWVCLFSGSAEGWGFLSYQKDGDSILIFGNGTDPVQVWDGRAETSCELTGVPARGRHFALHAERVWMCGESANPDRLYYSRMLDPNDWSGDTVTPETGGGFVDLPTFDGGRITNLYSVGGDLCILKSTCALLLYGTSPDNYQVTGMTGEMGTIAGRTAAVSGRTGYFITAHGIGVQSGSSVSLLDDRKLPRLFDGDYCGEKDCREGLSPHFGLCACGICHRERLYFALPLGEERTNSVVLEYDLTRETYALHDRVGAAGFARAGRMREKLLVLGNDGVVRLVGGGTPGGALWRTPWLDFGSSAEKVLRALTLSGRIESETGCAGVRVTVESDRGRKVRRLCTRDRPGDERCRRHRCGFRLGGRRFCVTLEAEEGTRFAFTGGLEMETEGGEGK